MGRAVPYVAQLELADCAAACLAMTLAYNGRYVPLEELREATGTGRDGVGAPGIVAAARQYGLMARGVKAETGDLACLPPGSVLHWDFDHFVVFEKVTPKGVAVVDPALGRRVVPADAFGRSYTGVAIILEPGAGFARGGEGRPSPYRYLRPILGQRVLARRVVVLSVLLQVLALAVPLFTAIVVNRIGPAGPGTRRGTGGRDHPGAPQQPAPGDGEPGSRGTFGELRLPAAGRHRGPQGGRRRRPGRRALVGPVRPGDL